MLLRQVETPTCVSFSHQKCDWLGVRYFVDVHAEGEGRGPSPLPRVFDGPKCLAKSEGWIQPGEALSELRLEGLRICAPYPSHGLGQPVLMTWFRLQEHPVGMSFSHLGTESSTDHGLSHGQGHSDPLILLFSSFYTVL